MTNLREQIARELRGNLVWEVADCDVLADSILAIFQDQLDKLIDTEDLNDLQRKIGAMLSEQSPR